MTPFLRHCERSEAIHTTQSLRLRAPQGHLLRDAERGRNQSTKVMLPFADDDSRFSRMNCERFEPLTFPYQEGLISYLIQ